MKTKTSIVCPKCQSSNIEIHETIDVKHHCSCLDCGKIFTKEVAIYAFSQAGNKFYFFPFYSEYFAIDKDTFDVLKIGFTKQGKREKRFKIEKDEKKRDFVFYNIYQKVTK